MTRKEVVLIFIGISYYGILLISGCNNDQEKIMPQRITITESVYSSATIQPDSLYQAHAIVAGILDKNLVEEGDLVKKGTPILQIINSSPKLNTDNARLALQLAQQNYSGQAAVLKDIQEQINAARLTLKNDSVNFYRQKNLWDQNIGSKAEFDNRKLAYELSQNNLRMLVSKYTRTKNELETQVQQAANRFRTAQISTEDFTVTSKIQGTIYALFKNPGEVVTTIEPLASVGSSDIFIIELLVDEVDIVNVELGQKVIITLEAYADQVFDARVHKIYPRKDERSQTFKVEAAFVDPPNTLYPGLSGEGNIIIAERKNAITIPKTYLIDGNKVQTADGLVKVKIGLQNLDRVEILDGIDVDVYLLRPEE